MWWIKIKTLWTLGLRNFYHVMVYRLLKKLGWYGKTQKNTLVPVGPFFSQTLLSSLNDLTSTAELETIISFNWQETARYFGYKQAPITTEPPDWHLNPFTKSSVDATLPWWKMQDFSADAGDIKVFWEASRWDWVVIFALRAKKGQKETLSQLNDWLSDWCIHNPPYAGINWKCGQEASIRVLHLAMAAILLEQTQGAAKTQAPTAGILSLVTVHLKRIALTFNYARAQDNNHATSEAAALFVGGSWLEKAGVTGARLWARKGRYWLEKLTHRLISSDGSFSQYSTNYHRVLLDTLSMVEIWRRHLGLPRFSKRWEARASVAAEWLAAMVDPQTGDVPNIGANDGARLLPLTETDYRDYRPSVQLAMGLFKGVQIYSSLTTKIFEWFGLSSQLKDHVKLGFPCPLRQSRILDQGGYAILKRHATALVVRYPRFRFRPSHADALHVDFWRNGENWFRDGGTYSYHTHPDALSYFPGTASHNTVQMDQRDQMPRLGRFLFGDWVKAFIIAPLTETEKVTRFAVGYRDGQGAAHRRWVALGENHLRIIDEIEGFSRLAVLRWRLKPGDWRIKGKTLLCEDFQMQIETSIPLGRFELVEGWESRYYLQKSLLPVLELELTEPGRIITTCAW